MDTSLGSGSLLSQESEGEKVEVEGERASVDVDKTHDKELFPMGYCGVTRLEDGWIDLACGPSISIAINYQSHNHDVHPGHSTPLSPNVLNIDIDAPIVLLRVFGCLGRDLLALKVKEEILVQHSVTVVCLLSDSTVSLLCRDVHLVVSLVSCSQENYPGEYINLTAFNSDIPLKPSPERPSDPPLVEAPPPNPPDIQDAPVERTLNVFCTFQLCNITAEFPTVSSTDMHSCNYDHHKHSLQCSICQLITPGNSPSHLPAQTSSKCMLSTWIVRQRCG